MHHLRERTPAEIAEQLGVSLAAARRLAVRALWEDADDLGDRLEVVERQTSARDAFVKYLFRGGDGILFEAVRIPLHRPRWSVCVSSQAGCAVGCTFCMTGTLGLLRQLGSAEIVAQVSLARSRRTIRRVVFMGMGEPAHNLENVMESIELFGTEGALGHKNLVFSTVGDRRIFERLPQGPVKPALALSLHTTKAALRAELLPRAQRFDPAELIELAQAYSRATTYPIQYQWTLLEGINDGDDELDRLAELLRGQYAVVNFILWNQVDGLPHTRTPTERAREIIRGMMQRGVLAKLRVSAGQDVDGGCGQLRARVVAGGVSGGER